MVECVEDGEIPGDVLHGAVDAAGECRVVGVGAQLGAEGASGLLQVDEGAERIGFPLLEGATVGKGRAFEVGGEEGGAPEVGAGEVGVLQAGEEEVGAAEVGALEVCAAEAGVSEVGALEAGVRCPWSRGAGVRTKYG